MYSFHFENRYSKSFAWIDYSEEEALFQLYNKNIPFITTLCDRYYDDYTFCEGELKQAQKDLMMLMDFTQWGTYKEEYEEQLKLLYKLIAVVSYAIFHQCNLVGSGD